MRGTGSDEAVRGDAEDSSASLRRLDAPERIERIIGLVVNAAVAACRHVLSGAWSGHRGRLVDLCGLGPLQRFNPAVLVIVLAVSIVAFALRGVGVVRIGRSLAARFGALT